MVLAVFFSTGFLQPAFARLGVGVGTGELSVDERLTPGGIYNLPPISVFNTGDEPADYRMSVTFHEDQPQQRLETQWIRFNPAEFHLEAGGAQTVEIELHLPLRMPPGDYFAYLEAGPLQEVESGESKIALAAATKLYFSVDAANLWWALYYKAIALWRQYAPWTYIGLGVLSLMAVIIFMRGRFRLKPRRIKLS